MESRNSLNWSRWSAWRPLAAVWIVLGALACVGCAGSAPPPLQRFEFSKIVMGSRARIVLYAPSPDEARTAARAAFDEIEALEQSLSDYRATSEVNALRTLPPGQPARVSIELARAIDRSLAISRRTDGAFDITIGPVVALWRAAQTTGQLPDDAARRHALTAVGWHKLRFDADRREVVLAAPGMQLDFGGIGKGMACDVALDAIAARGVDRALVEVGGDLAVADPPPGREGWRIAAGPARSIELRNAAIASSGSTERFIEIDGVRYSHIVDPRTGIGVDPGLLVVVVADDGATADALASAMCVVGIDRIDALLAEFPGSFGLVHLAGDPPRPVGDQRRARRFDSATGERSTVP